MIDKETDPGLPRVFIVEDEAIIAMRLERLLTHLDYKVVGMASRGEEAIQAVEEKRPDLILMDIQLAGEIDGVETAARIREHFDTPIIYLSAHPERMITEEVQRTEPAGFLSKPVRDQDLIATIEMALYKHRMEAKLRESEMLLVRSQQIAQVGSWMLDVATNRLTWSDEVYRIFGLEPREFTATYEAFLNAVHPADRAAVDAAYNNSLREGNDGYEIEHRIVRQDSGEIRRVHEKCIHERSEAGVIYRSVGMVQDITARKQAEDALRESEARYKRLVENTYDLIYRYELTPERGFTYVSPAATEITGYTPEEHYADPDLGFKLVHPEDQPLLEKITYRSPEFQKPLILRWIKKDGSIIWTEQRNIPIYNDAGQLIALEGIARDITERKRAEEKLRVAEETYRNIFLNAQVGMFRTDIQTGLILDANDAVARFAGYRDREEMLAEPFSIADRYVNPGDREKMISLLSTHGEITNFEAPFRRKDGTTILMRFSARLVPDKGWIEGVSVDVTKEEQAKEALRESEEKYRRLVERSPDILYIYSEQRGASYWSQRVQEVLGYAPADLIKNPYLWHDAIHPDDVAAVDAAIADSEKGAGFEIKYRIQDTDGNWRWFHDRFISKRFVDGECIIEGLATDITERKRADEDLRDSEQKYRVLFEHALNPILIVDEEGNYIDANEAALAFMECDREALLGKSVWDFTVPGEMGRVKEEHAPFLEPRTLETDYYIRGRIKTLLLNVVPVIISGRQVLYGIGQEITERKRAEEKIESERAFLSAVLDNIEEAVVICDKEGRIARFNKAARQLHGLPERPIPPEQWAEYYDLCREDGTTPLPMEEIPLFRALQGEHVRDAELVVAPTHGESRSLVCNGQKLVDESGQVSGAVIAMHDITARKQAEKALSRSMERLTIQHDIDTAILHAQSPEQIALAALARLHDLVPCQRASITELDPEQQRGRDMIVLINGQVQAQGLGWRPMSSIGPRLLRAVEQGESMVVKDITALETPSLLEQKLAEAGMRAYVSVPLIVQDTPLGTLNLACDTPCFFRSEHIEILEEIAASLTVALQQARLLTQTQKDAETKAMLLHEVNHRVMNNLTMILSLLELEIGQPRPVDDPNDLQAVLRDIHSRIYGIATVHRMLGELGKEEHGDLQDSLDLETLVSKVIEAALSASPHQQWVDVVVDAAENLPRLSERQATTLALIINELTTNSAKHAFVDRAEGRIHVQIALFAGAEDEEERVCLVYRDDGPGLPEDVLAGERQNVGLWLARENATHTLDGEIAWSNDEGPDGGAVVEVQFPVRSRE